MQWKAMPGKGGPHNVFERWILIPDPDKIVSPSTLRRRRSQERKAAGTAAKLGDQNHKRGAAPFPLEPEDRVRIKLRDRQRKLIKYDGKAPTDLPTLPGVHGFDFAMRYVDGGRATVVAFIQLAMLERIAAAEQWYAVYADLLPYERACASFDDICCAAGVKPSQLMAAVVSVAMEQGRDAGNLVAALAQAQVVAAMAASGADLKSANAEISHKDRIAFLQGAGMLPVPKGASIHVHTSANAQAAAAVAADPSVPAFGSDMATLAAGRAAARQLPEAAEPAFLRGRTVIDIDVDVDAEPAVLISPDADESD